MCIIGNSSIHVGLRIKVEHITDVKPHSLIYLYIYIFFIIYYLSNKDICDVF